MIERNEALRRFTQNQALFRELLGKRLDGHKKEFRQIMVAHFDVTTTVTLTVAELGNLSEDYLEAVLPAVAADTVEAFFELLQQLDAQSDLPN